MEKDEKNNVTPLKQREKGEKVIIGVANPVIGSPCNGKIKPVIKLIFRYDRTKTSVRVIYDKFFSLTDEVIMPLREDDTIWICSKDKHNENQLTLVDEVVTRDGMAIVKNIVVFDATKDGIASLDEKYQEYAEYVINKLYN